MTLTTFERETVRDELARDERIQHEAETAELLDQIATEIAKIRRTADMVTSDYAAPHLALDLVDAVGRFTKPRRHVATIVHLLAELQNTAVKQARAHGATWEQIAEKTGETRPNLHARFHQ